MGGVRVLGAMTIILGLLEVSGAWTLVTAWLKLHWITSYQSPL
jgi:hypothetical protein